MRVPVVSPLTAGVALAVGVLVGLLIGYFHDTGWVKPVIMAVSLGAFYMGMSAYSYEDEGKTRYHGKELTVFSVIHLVVWGAGLAAVVALLLSGAPA